MSNEIEPIGPNEIEKHTSAVSKALNKSYNLSNKQSREDYVRLKKFDNLLKKVTKKNPLEFFLQEIGIFTKEVIDDILSFAWLTNDSKAKESETFFDGMPRDPEIKKREDELFKIAKTNNAKYKESLAALAYAIDEEDIPILFVGEVGVGKSFIAGKIHTISKRSKKSYVAVDCAGVSETNLYPNIFGALKGSFTGSVKDLKGMISEADGGTLFIDEIDKASKFVRYNLKTFIDTRKYLPLGTSIPRSADVRLIAGTNKDLRQLIKKGEFEEDLFSRLCGRIIHIPPLRERKEDIPLLIDSVVNSFNSRNKIQIQIDIEALNYLINFNWPQNMRQLEYYLNVMFGDCSRYGANVLTLERIKRNPPESFESKVDLDSFESVLKNYLDSWKSDDGKFLNDFIEPIVSKIYLEDHNSGVNQSKKYELAMEILGISGDRRSDSTLHKQYLRYESIKKRLA